MKNPLVRIIISLSFCLLCLFLIKPGALANELSSANAGINIQAVLGFSETFRIGRWTPLTVTLTNHSNDLVGQLNVEVAGGDEFGGGLFKIHHQRDIQLPKDSRKRFRFNVFLDNPSRPLTIRVSNGAQDLATYTIDLRQRFTDARLVLVLSRDADLDYLNDSSGTRLRALYPHPELLPDRWQGYDGVDALIIHGLSLESLSARQFEAIKKWLARGGIIAVSADPNYILLRTPRLTELLPALPLEITQLSDVSIVGEHSNHLNNAPRLFDVHRIMPPQGRILYRAGEFPLIIEHSAGLGRVLYLTFDVARSPFANWPGMKQLWLNSLRLPPLQPLSFAAKKGTGENPVLDVIRRQAKGFAQHASILVFLILYLGVLATGYRLAVNSEINQRLLLWLTWIAPFLFAPAAYFLFGPLLYPKGDNAVVLTTVEPFPDSIYAHAQLDLGLYSIQSSASASALDFYYRGIEPVFQPVRRVTPFKQAEDWVFREGNQLSLHPNDHRDYVLHSLTGEDIVVFDISGKIDLTASGPLLNLRNNSGRALHHSWLIFDNNAYALGLIAEDAELKQTFNDNNALGLWDVSLQNTPGASPDSLLSYPQAAELMLKHTIENLRKPQQQSFDHALLLGFSNNPMQLTGASADWQRIELTLLRLSLPVVSSVPATENNNADSEK